MKTFFTGLVVAFLYSSSLMAQISESVSDSIQTSETEDTKRWDVALDLVSRYIWRGQSWGGNFMAAQPSFNYAITKKLTIGTWATTNFQKDYYYSDGVTENKGYQEVDLGLTYQLTNFLSVQLWDYYWPTFEKLEGVDQNYFNYGPDGVQSVDASLVFDFSDGYQFAFDATLSTLVAGNDYRYNADGENPKQNYTTYVEAGYTFANLFDGVSAKTFKNISLHPTVGCVLNNQAEYYTYADYDKPSFVNLALNATREFDLGRGITMPLILNYTHNAANKNTEIYGRDFLTAGISFWY